MSQPPPPPAGPPPSPSYPPPGQPEPTPSASGRAGAGIFLIIAVAVLMVVGAAVAAAITLSGGDPTSVDAVAGEAVDAAEDLDVGAGIDLLCDPPTSEERSDLSDLIGEARDRAGTGDPDVDYEISEVEGDGSGSFVVTVTSEEDGLDDERIEMRVLVEEDGDRSCIAGVEEVD